jgi:hypothetical protein
MLGLQQSARSIASLEGLAGLFRRTFLLNFGVVEPGRVYRSGRSGRPGRHLPGLVETYRLASILDLDGCHIGKELGMDSWCIAEVRGDGDRKVDVFQFPISFERRPPREELAALIAIYECRRYPLLILCDTGADRAGLAVGVYLMAIRGVGPERALRAAFAPRFGHVPILGAEHLHEPFREYAARLRERRLDHTPGRLKAWLEAVDRSTPTTTMA